MGSAVNVPASFPERLFAFGVLFLLNPLTFLLALGSIPRIIKSGSDERLFILSWFFMEVATVLLLYPHVFYQHFYLSMVLAYIVAGDVLPALRAFLRSVVYTYRGFGSLVLYFLALAFLAHVLIFLNPARLNTTPSLEHNLAVGSYLAKNIRVNESLLVIGNPIYYPLSSRSMPDGFLESVPYFDHYSYIFIYADKGGLESFGRLIGETKVDYILFEETLEPKPKPLESITNEPDYAAIKQALGGYGVDSKFEKHELGRGRSGVFYLLKRRGN